MRSRVLEPISDHHVGQRHLDRLVMLSDGVFAIAITSSTIEIRPEARPGQTLWQVWSTPLLIYFFSFLIIGLIWANHRRMVAHLRDIDAIGTVLNLVLLSLVALMPLVTRFIFADAAHGVDLLIFALALMATFTCMAVLWGYLAFVAGLAPDLDRSTAMLWLLEMLSPPIGAMGVVL
ncbi:MAG: TMEM175 family protein [Rhodanobacter sp.]